MIVIKRPIICMAAIDWHYLLHRPQQLMLRLVRAGHPVHYRNPGQIPGFPPEEVISGLWVYRDFDRLPPEVAIQAIYFIYFPAYAAWLDVSLEKFIVYDCIDDDPVFESHEDLMLSKANLVLCVSNHLIRKFQEKHPRLVLMTNGVDLNHYRPRPEPCPAEMAPFSAAGKPIIGFTGAFYRGWVDMELVYAIAANNPQWQVVIIGEPYGWDFRGAPANLRCLGPRPYEVLPSYVRYFSVGLIPFVDNQIARGADPVKLYEYLAAGVPVVSRALPFVNGIGAPMVYTYQTPQECMRAIRKAINDNAHYSDLAKIKRIKFASRNSWDSKVELLLRELGKLTWLEK